MKAEQLLRKCGLSRTSARLQVIDLLAQSERPVSGTEILERLAHRCDKSTVYRTVNALFDKGMLTRVIVDHEVKYTLKTGHTEGSGHPGDHVHFKCENCNKVYCLKELPIDDYDLPEGFIKSENHFLIIGTCGTCTEQKKTERK